MKKGFIIFCTCLLFTARLSAQEHQKVFSISDCINYATENSSRIRMAGYDEDIAQKQANEILGRALPQASINGSFENRLKLPLLVIPGDVALPGMPTGGGGIPMGFKYSTMLTGEVTQMIFDPSFGSAMKGAAQNKLLYSQQTQQTKEQIAYNIAGAYYNVIVYLQQHEQLNSNLYNTQQSLDNTLRLYENGLAKQVDVNRLRVNINNLQSQIRQTELGHEQALNMLKFHMGMPLEQEIVLKDTELSFSPQQDLPESGTENLYERRIGYKMLQTNLMLQETERQNALRGYLPTLRAFANYGYQAQGPDFHIMRTSGNEWIDFNTSTIGLRLNIPVFDGLQRHSRIQMASIRIKQLEENKNLTRQNIDLEVSNARTGYQNTLQRIEAERRNVELAEEVYAVTQLEFAEGMSTSTDLVGAETALRQAQNTYTRTLLDLYTARLDMELAGGNLLDYLNSK